MLFEFNFYSCTLLIPFIHIVVYALLLIKRSHLSERYADRLMGVFLVLAAMTIIPFMVGFAGWYDTQPYRDILFFVPLVHTLFFGPLLYFYTRSVFDASFHIKGKQYLHFLPGALYLIYSVGHSVIDLTITKSYLQTLERQDPDFDEWYNLISMASFLFYLMLSIRYYWKFVRFAAITTSFAEQASAKWLRNFLYAFTLLCTLSLTKAVLSNFEFFERMRYFGPWYYYVGFAITTYYIAISAYHTGLLPMYKLHFGPQMLAQFENNSIPEPNLTPENQKLTITDRKKMEDIAQELELLMQDQKLYERADLTLTEVAKKLGTNPVILSRVVNQTFDLNFNDYINRYRTQAVVQMIENGQSKNLTLLALALEAGFNSKATFNRAFKKFTGKNPKDYLGSQNT